MAHIGTWTHFYNKKYHQKDNHLKKNKDHNDFFKNYRFVVTFQGTSSYCSLYKLQVKMLNIDSKTLL